MTFAIVASKCVHTSSIVGAEALSETHSSMSRMENQDTSDTPRKHPLSNTLLCPHPEHTARTHTCGFFTGNWLFCYQRPILREEFWIPEAHSLDFYHFVQLILEVLSCCNGITSIHIFSLIRPCLFWGREHTAGTWYTDTPFCWRN